MPAYQFQITRRGNLPVIVDVEENGQQRQFLYSCHLSDRRIEQLLPRLVMDSKWKPKRKAV